MRYEESYIFIVLISDLGGDWYEPTKTTFDATNTNLCSHWCDLTAQVTSGSTSQEMTLTVSCQVFSLNSEELLSVVYSGKVSHSVTDSKTLNMDKSNNYYEYTLIYVLDTQLDVTTASGDGVTVNAS